MGGLMATAADISVLLTQVKASLSSNNYKCAYRLNAAERKMWRRLLSDA